MIGIILYIFAVVAVSGLVTFFFTVSRPIHTKGESQPWKTFIFMAVACTALPFISFELMTRKVGPSIKPALEDGLEDAGLTGDLTKYKVIFYDGKHATVMAACVQQAKWGGMDQPIIRMKVEQKAENKWAVVSYQVLQSDDLEKDQVVFPPFF